MLHLESIILSNQSIFDIVSRLQLAFDSGLSQQYRAIIGFMIQYNYMELLNIAIALDKARGIIGKKYGVWNDKTEEYDIILDNFENAQKEMNELLEAKQEIKLYRIPLSELQEYNFTMGQMRALIPFIKNDME